jgi:hypothetical protein
MKNVVTTIQMKATSKLLGKKNSGIREAKIKPDVSACPQIEQMITGNTSGAVLEVCESRAKNTFMSYQNLFTFP